MKILKATRKSRIDIFLVKISVILSIVLSIIIAYMIGSYHGFTEGGTATLRMIYFQVNSGRSMNDAIETTEEVTHAGNINNRESR